MLSASELHATDLAGRQAGYLTRRQALACGMTKETIRYRLQSHRWVHVRPGLYLILGFPPTLRGRLLAATATLGAVVSHESAAQILEMPDVIREKAVVTVRSRTTHFFPDVLVHQSTDLTDDQVIEIEAMPVTSPIRTVIDLAACLKPGVVGRIVDHLVVRRTITLDDLVGQVERLARKGKPGITCIRRVIEVRIGETLIGESALELMTLRLFREWGFPEPVLQLALPWRSPRKGRVDLAFPQFRLIIEVDGRAWHATLDAFDSDRMRDNHAQLAGWRVIRITYRMLKDQPEMVRNLIKQALETPAA
ncbi:MAG: type IV toxin-antitoxin system AbiEi family antitoxin domain-containing protein [Actinomycetota bacterium]